MSLMVTCPPMPSARRAPACASGLTGGLVRCTLLISSAPRHDPQPLACPVDLHKKRRRDVPVLLPAPPLAALVGAGHRADPPCHLVPRAARRADQRVVRHL